ncbi:mannose-1-phosphate guanylyltransferase [Pseudidiomarina marina]|uniref:Mannose-1-phosphate guanylyltransferase n=2 Tax=Pseudidiomarina marina TaxID=502366 RepID=A0A432YD99_9GAMM|nr:mannose-1-phosphate guanylyltransferase [Pseudidiomarina marina]
MRAMILAAGRGERMRPLTDTTPKPLLRVRGKPLIEYHLEKLAAQGIKQVVINHAWLGEQLVQALGNGKQFGLEILFSPEPEGGLETAGGIIRALPMLGDEPFWVINGDIFTTLDFSALPRELPAGIVAHLLLANNPPHNAHGDFAVQSGMLQAATGSKQTYTYTGMGLFSPQLFSDYQSGSEQFIRLRPLLDSGIENEQIAASIISAEWTDVGTPKRLAQLQEYP